MAAMHFERLALRLRWSGWCATQPRVGTLPRYATGHMSLVSRTSHRLQSTVQSPKEPSTSTKLVPEASWSAHRVFVEKRPYKSFKHKFIWPLRKEGLRKMERLCSLAKLAPFSILPKDEKKRIVTEMASMMRHISAIQMVDTKKVRPMISVMADEECIQEREDELSLASDANQEGEEDGKRQEGNPHTCGIGLLKREAEGDRMRGAYYVMEKRNPKSL